MTCDECGEGFQPGDDVVVTKAETVLETDDEGRIDHARWYTIIEEYHAECI